MLAAALLAGCGGSSSEEEVAGQLGPKLGAEVRLADCEDWKGGDVNERLGTIREIRNFAGGPVGTGGGRGATLEDEEAYQLFESYCEEEFARGFKLYKLYTRAAAFSGLR